MSREEFDWSEVETVQNRVQRVAVYLNPSNQIVIRQERDWDDDEDKWIVLDPFAALRLAGQLKKLVASASAPADREG